MKELNTDRIDTILCNFFKDIDLWCSVGLDTDFYYYPESDHIGYALVVSERTAKLFPEFAKANGLQYETPIFILCLLHEIGHYYTIGLFSDDEICDFDEQKEKLGDNDNDFITYFSIPHEFEATMWAINFINTHPSQIKLLDLSLAQAFEEFKTVNGIED